MITRFYKILNKDEDVIYIGVTTRTIDERFREHILAKGLNKSGYCIVEFNKIEHPDINSIEVYYQEKQKVAELECEYIKEAKMQGHSLLNISNGGEWCENILSKLRKEKFIEIYGSYDNYKQYHKNKKRLYNWIRHWYAHRTDSKIRKWLWNWRINKSNNQTLLWLRRWSDNKSANKTYLWLKHWTEHRTTNKTKMWLQRWVTHRGYNKTRGWIWHWVIHRSDNKTKVWIQSWQVNRAKNKTKVWLQNWVVNRKNK